MADYYPLLARAIGGLPNKGRDARNVVFERARKALLAQLRNADPPLREEDITREQSSLEDAIRRLELDYAEPPAAAPAIEPPPAPEPAESAAPEPAPDEPADREPTFDEPAPAEDVAPEPAASPDVEAPVAAGDPAPRPSESRFGAARYEAAQPREAGTFGLGPLAAPASPAPRVEPDELEGYEDLVEAAAQRRASNGDWHGEPPAQGADFGALRPGDTDTARGPAERGGEIDGRHPDSFDDETPRRGRGLLIAIAILVVLAALGVVGYLKSDALVAMFNGASAPPELRGDEPPVASAPATPEVSKSTDRIAQAPTTNGQRVAPAQPGVQTLGVAERAVLFEESAGGGDQGLQQFVGSVVWSTDTFSPGDGMAPDIGIKAEITIPDRGIKATLRLRRNQDASIPASHIVEIQYELPPNFDLGNVQNVPGIRAKASEGAQGAPLTGLAVRVAPGYFLIGLSALDIERQRNLGLLITRNWIDLPMVFENGRRAILVLEKGVPGDQAFRQTFSAWGLPLPPQEAPQGAPAQ
ncbi:hypothetical protein MKI84_17910 [Ancylobacter sp. A5.8]|uniref:hypothetical protein n=1 Tax=Ancylobacter gelatini TaxID=2919920 RepID=UPI001F4DCDE1|nr:hypothetical protein [Ancylobacter gelatini]MCJ8144800.1 hypothetical protein [Ancylobacter gelatini]